MKIIIPIKLKDPRYEEILYSIKNQKNKYYYKCLPSGEKVLNDVYVLAANGSLNKIKNYANYLQSMDLIWDIYLDRFKNEIDTPEKMEEEYMKAYDKIDKGNVNDEESSLEVAKNAMRLTCLHLLMENRMDNSTQEEKDDITKVALQVRDKEEDENIRTEMDLVNNIIRKTFPNNDKAIEILACEYNGESMEQEEIIEEISSHYFPAYITQKDIMTTMSDEYVIKTNIGTIVRSKGGIIKILENEE